MSAWPLLHARTGISQRGKSAQSSAQRRVSVRMICGANERMLEPDQNGSIAPIHPWQATRKEVPSTPAPSSAVLPAIVILVPDDATDRVQGVQS